MVKKHYITSKKYLIQISHTFVTTHGHLEQIQGHKYAIQVRGHGLRSLRTVFNNVR